MIILFVFFGVGAWTIVYKFDAIFGGGVGSLVVEKMVGFIDNVLPPSPLLLSPYD